MTEFLILKLFSSGLLSILLLLPLYYLLGYSTLSMVNGICYLRFKQSHRFQFEDVLVAAIATLSLIITGCRLVGVFPQVQLIFQLSTVVSIICLLFSFCYSRFSGIKYRFLLPSWQHSLIWLFLFSNYLIRAVIKARSFDEAQYIPSGFNTDIFLYIRRSIVFLGEGTQTQLENNQTILDILYNSPKLLSTFVYATFTYVNGDIGIAATIVTSVVLAAIILKYLIKYLTLIKTKSNFNYSIVTIALIVLIVFQPIWCWLQDQFYWSNLLSIYLLIYALEDLISLEKISSIHLVKFAIAIIALVGFYPSQLPFFMISMMIGIVFNSVLDNRSRHKYLLAILLITFAVACLFITQYLNTGEVVQHFNLSDAEHGQKFNYIPFWSFLDFIPQTGGTPKDLGAILLISASVIIGFLTVKYCIQAVPKSANWFKLLIILYTIYSFSYLILPGEYRQSKFLFTYIVPLFLFCLIETFSQVNWQRQQTVKILLSVLAVYVGVKSCLKPYKPHVSSEIVPAIATVNSLHKPTLVYINQGSIAHGYYYFAYQIRNLDFQLISGCPKASELNSLDTDSKTVVIASSCPKIAVKTALQPKIIYTDINGSVQDDLE
jgi:hypothetical protein